MEENSHTFICRQCRNIFKMPVSSGHLPGESPECPGCGSSQLEEVPSWSPVGSNIATGISEWEYQCQQCQTTFKSPIPASPTQEKELQCPICGGNHIHRLTKSGAEPLYCG